MARRINLLPRAERVRTTTNVGALVLLVFGLVVAFALGLGYYLLNTERSNLEDELAQKQRARAELVAQVAALDEYKKLATQVAQVQKVVTSVYAGRTLLSNLFSDLSLVIPENVWLTTLTVSAGSPGMLTESGVYTSGVGNLTMQGNTYSFPDVATYLVRLKLIDALLGITLSSAGPPIGNVDTEKDVKGFSLSADVINTQPVDTQLPISKVKVEGL